MHWETISYLSYASVYKSGACLHFFLNFEKLSKGLVVLEGTFYKKWILHFSLFDYFSFFFLPFVPTWIFRLWVRYQLITITRLYSLFQLIWSTTSWGGSQKQRTNKGQICQNDLKKCQCWVQALIGECPIVKKPLCQNITL